MFSRFWYFALAAVTAAALAAAYLVHAAMGRSTEHALEEALHRDRFEVELWMSLDDAARLSAIAPMTANGEVRAVLAEANARPANGAIPAGSRQRIDGTLAELNQQLREGRADVLVALDRNGLIVSQVGGGAPALDASLRDLDLVRSCLEGEPKSGIWMRDRVPLRAAARPVIVGGTVIGAIVHAMEIDDDLARRLSSRVEGSSIGFFYGERMIAAATAEGSGEGTGREPMQTILGAARANPALRSTGRTDSTALGDSARAIVALFPGQPLEGQLGFVVARAAVAPGSPFATLASAPSDDVGGLPWGLVLGLPLLLALVGVALVTIEKDRPLQAFAAEVRRIADGSATKMTSTGLKPQYRILAEDVNAALERANASAVSAQRKSQSLDQLLGSAPPSSSVPAFYAMPEATPVPAAPPAPRPTAPELPKTVPPPKPAPAPPVPTTSAVSQAISMPPQEEDDDDTATTVAQIPAELLGVLQQDADDEEQHFRAVFEEYLRVRTQCGEPTKGLTYEKLVLTLRKTKEQIVQKHGGSRVRFSVYVKDGKAALKASPK